MDIQEWINRRQALLAQMAPNSAALFLPHRSGLAAVIATTCFAKTVIFGISVR